MSANQNSYHYYAAMELLGDLAVALSSYDNGIRYYGKLSEAPWPDYQMRATVLQANAMVASGLVPRCAARSTRKCSPSSVDDARAREQKLLATLGKAVCLAETGQAQTPSTA